LVSLRDQLLDLAHAPVFGALKNLLVIVLGEVSGELMNPTEVELPARDHAKNAGKTTGRATCSDAPRGNRLGHVKALRTEGEHRGESVLEVELSPIDLGDVGEHDGGVATVLIDQVGEIAEELLLLDVL
jgi:hypothetical protein